MFYRISLGLEPDWARANAVKQAPPSHQHRLLGVKSAKGTSGLCQITPAQPRWYANR